MNMVNMPLSRRTWTILGSLCVVLLVAVAAHAVSGNVGNVTVFGVDGQTEIELDDEPMPLQGRKATREVWAGEHRLKVRSGPYQFETESFSVARGEEIRVRIETVPEQARALIGRRAIGMDPRPEPTGPVAIMTSGGTYLRSADKGMPIETDASSTSPAATFTVEWQKHDLSEAYIHDHQGHYLRGIEMEGDDFVTVDQRAEPELFEVRWSDRDMQMFRLMTPMHGIYVCTPFERNRLATTGTPGADTLFRFVSISDQKRNGPPPGRTLRLVRSLQGHTGTVSDVAVSDDGRLIATASGWPKGDRTARVWDATTGKQLQLMQHLKGVESVAFSPDAKSILTGREQVAARLLDIESGQEVGRFKGRHNCDVTGVAFLPGNRIVILCETDEQCELRVWDVATGKLVDRVNAGDPFSGRRPERPRRTSRMEVTADGSKVVVTIAKSMNVYRSDNWKRIASVRHPWLIESVAFSPDGRHVLTSMFRPENQVRLIQVDGGEEIRRFEQIGQVGCMTFLPSGQHFATASHGDDPQLSVWEVDTGERIAWANLTSDYLTLTATPDGDLLGGGGATWLHQAGSDFAVHLWRLPPTPSE